MFERKTITFSYFPKVFYWYFFPPPKSPVTLRKSSVLSALHHRQFVAAVSSPQSPLRFVSASGENAARFLGSPLPTGPASLGSRGGPIYFYLYFRLSATASSSQRLLNSFSAWISHPASRMGALFYLTRYGRNESARRQGPAPPDAWTARRAAAPLGRSRATPRKPIYTSDSPAPPVRHSGC